MNALLLLLLDSRAPAGAHHHSGGMAAAIMAGLVTDLTGTEDFGRTRLRTSAEVSAAFAAASCRLFINERGGLPAYLAKLDAEYGARIPSEATRRASRELGRGLTRLLRSFLPETDLATAFARCAGPSPHHALTWTRSSSSRPGTLGPRRWSSRVVCSVRCGAVRAAAGGRVLACALISDPAASMRTAVESAVAVAQRLNDHTVLVSVLEDDAARAVRRLGGLCTQARS